MNKKSDITIKYSSRILFSITVILAVATAIVSFFLVLLIQSSSFFVLAAVDMPPSTSPSPSPPTTTEKPSTPPPSTTTSTTPPNLPKIEEKKDPKDGDTILSSTKSDNDVSVATKVDKKSNTETMDFNRGYVMGFAMVLDTEASEVFQRSKFFQGQIINIQILFEGYPEEFQNGFMLGYVSASDYLNTFGLLDKSGSPAKK